MLPQLLSQSTVSLTNRTSTTLCTVRSTKPPQYIWAINGSVVERTGPQNNSWPGLLVVTNIKIWQPGNLLNQVSVMCIQTGEEGYIKFHQRNVCTVTTVHQSVVWLGPKSAASITSCTPPVTAVAVLGHGHVSGLGWLSPSCSKPSTVSKGGGKILVDANVMEGQ